MYKKMASRRTTTKERGGIIWLVPGQSTYKITVERNDGTVDDITDLISSVEVEDGTTENIGRFSFNIWNPNETYTTTWNNMDVFRYYKDYAAAATTLRFRGRIEKISKQGNKLKVSGRGEALKFMDVTVTKQYSDVECGIILKDLIGNYGTGFTDNNVSASSVSLTVNWYQKPFWECVQELCTAAGFDCYVDSALDFHFFEEGSVVNKAEGVVHDLNLVSIGDFADDSSLVKNRVIVYGAQEDGIQVFNTSEDTASQAAYGVREEIISDSNVTDETQAQEQGDYFLAKYKDPTQVGEVKSFMLASVKPGDYIKISSPADSITPANYKVISYKDEITHEGGNPPYTTVRINKEPRQAVHILKKLVENDNKAKGTNLNPHEMRFSYNFLFNSDSGTHFNTEIADGVLKLKSGETSGNWVSPVRVLNNNITEVFPIAKGKVLSSMQFEVSGVDGNEYQTLFYNTKSDINGSNQGKRLRIRITLTNATTECDSISLQYKT